MGLYLVVPWAVNQPRHASMRGRISDVELVWFCGKRFWVWGWALGDARNSNHSTEEGQWNRP